MARPTHACEDLALLTLTDRTAPTPSRAAWSKVGRAVLAIALSFAIFAAPRTMAQGGLPAEIARKITPPSGEETAAIKKFVTERVADLGANDAAVIGSAEATKIKRARQELLEPLADTQVSAPFRIEYARQLDQALQRLSADKRDIVAINALIIAGELAADPGVAILEKQLGAKDPVVRYTAARGMGLTFEAVERSAPALSTDRAQKMVKTFGERLASETDPRVVDTLARALVAAMRLTNQKFVGDGVPAKALVELSLRLGARLHVSPEKADLAALFETAVNSGVATREALSNVNSRLPDAARHEAAGFAGDMLALSARAIRGGKEYAPIQSDDSNEVKASKVLARVPLAQAAALAEAILALTAGSGYKSQNLSDLIKTAILGDDARFLVGAGQIFGPDGMLVKAPFDFPPSRFADPK